MITESFSDLSVPYYWVVDVEFEGYGRERMTDVSLRTRRALALNIPLRNMSTEEAELLAHDHGSVVASASTSPFGYVAEDGRGHGVKEYPYGKSASVSSAQKFGVRSNTDYELTEP